MSHDERLVTAGRVGRPHGLDGSVRVESPVHPLSVGTAVTVQGAERVVRRRAGTDDRPLIRLDGVGDRDAAAALRGELLLVRESEAPLGDKEWLAADLVGCLVPGVGRVSRVLEAPSCDLLELDDGTLVPLVGDAVTSVDVAAGRIDVDRRFLGLVDEAE
ncbi:MAG: ribosome maturation factor RimM [Actinomycetota bacterium]|nr:ribosome maturation factor RimM [Actinomycetota bacterium]